MPDWFSQLIYSSLFLNILTLLIIIILTIVALRLVKISADTIDRRIIATIEDTDRRSRLQTLRKAGKSTVQVIILVIAVLIVLATFGIDIRPALAAAGILGLAVSLGAQTLIKDVIGGLTILLEDEYRVGDQIKIGTVSGEVEHITLRRTDVRDGDGRLFIVPNGEVRIVANETRNWARAVVELNFALNSDINQAMAALDKALAKLAIDPDVKPNLLAAPEIFGWNAINEWSVVVRLSAKVTAGKQGIVARSIRQYALEALRESGVTIESRNRMTPEPGKS